MVAQQKTVSKRRVRRRFRVRKSLKGTADRPRLSVFRSNKHIYCQLIDDVARKTICSSSTRDKAGAGGYTSAGGADAAAVIGKSLGEKALAAGVTQVCFDRGPYRYHGRVKAVAEGARAAGLRF